MFPYTEDVVSRTSAVTDRTILRPAMTVTMIGREEQSVLALVDSGSEHTLSGMGLARLIDLLLAWSARGCSWQARSVAH
jgi:hypothetical protein